jgi:hypothetical protein
MIWAQFFHSFSEGADQSSVACAAIVIYVTTLAMQVQQEVIIIARLDFIRLQSIISNNNIITSCHVVHYTNNISQCGENI